MARKTVSWSSGLEGRVRPARPSGGSTSGRGLSSQNWNLTRASRLFQTLSAFLAETVEGGEGLQQSRKDHHMVFFSDKMKRNFSIG